MLYGVVALAIASVFGGSGSFAEVSPVPLRDIIQLCSHNTGDQATVKTQLVNRGWTEMTEDYPEWVPSLFGDGELMRLFVVSQFQQDIERFNTLGMNLDTGEFTDITQIMNEMLVHIDQNKYSVLWTGGEMHALLQISTEPGDDKKLYCRLYGTDSAELETVVTAFDAAPGLHSGKNFGPVSQMTTVFRGLPPHEALTGLLGLLVDIGFLIDRPMHEPQLAAGPSHMTVTAVNEPLFLEHFGRNTNTRYVIAVTQHTSN